MAKFPVIKAPQVALVRADGKTGHVLDEGFHLATKAEQRVYTIYDNLNDAILAAQNIVGQQKDVECVIYDHNNIPIQSVFPLG